MLTKVEVFGREAIAAPGGFLVPGKQDGAVKIIDISGAKPKTYDITSNPNGNDFYWFYHTVLWRDMNGDGRMDAVTARANIDTWGGKATFFCFRKILPPKSMHFWSSVRRQLMLMECKFKSVKQKLSYSSVFKGVSVTYWQYIFEGFFTHRKMCIKRCANLKKCQGMFMKIPSL